MIEIIPINRVPDQYFNVSLGGQRCRIHLYQRTTGMYFDLSVNDQPVVVGVLCRQSVGLVRGGYLGFAGQIALFDTLDEGLEPEYTQLGTRYQLRYYS